jgi:hypothetical protein
MTGNPLLSSPCFRRFIRPEYDTGRGYEGKSPDPKISVGKGGRGGCRKMTLPASVADPGCLSPALKFFSSSRIPHPNKEEDLEDNLRKFHQKTNGIWCFFTPLGSEIRIRDSKNWSHRIFNTGCPARGLVPIGIYRTGIRWDKFVNKACVLFSLL